MKNWSKYIRNTLNIGLCLCFSVGVSGQIIDFTFDTKDYDEIVKPLNERLDSEKNYLVLFSAFWCQPCVKQLDDVFSKNIDIYRDLYNLEIIILNDDHYNQTNIALNKIRDKQWYFHQFMTDRIFIDLGINSIPRDYLIIAGKTEGKRVHSSSFLSALESHYIESGYDSPFFSDNSQQLSSSDCTDIDIHNYGLVNTATYINKEYYAVDGQYYRSGVLNKNIYRYDLLAEKEILVFDYYLDKCDEFTLRDQEGDAIQISIESSVIEDGEIVLETNQTIKNDCGDNVPFIMSSAYGSNAGLIFDIENDEIVSRLICHTKDNQSIYMDTELADLCESVSTVAHELQNKIYLTNNPGNGIFEMVGSQNLQVNIFDVNGQEVSFRKSGAFVDITTFPAGVYLVSVGSKSTIYIKH